MRVLAVDWNDSRYLGVPENCVVELTVACPPKVDGLDAVVLHNVSLLSFLPLLEAARKARIPVIYQAQMVITIGGCQSTSIQEAFPTVYFQSCAVMQRLLRSCGTLPATRNKFNPVIRHCILCICANGLIFGFLHRRHDLACAS